MNHDNAREVPPPRARLPRRILRWAKLAILSLAIVVMLAWATVAIHFSPLPGSTLRNVLAGAFALGVVGAFAFLENRRRTMWCFFICFAMVLGGWMSIRPATDIAWAPEVSLLPYADINDDLITVHNIRNFDYRTETDFDVHYDTRTYDLKELASLDLLAVDWGVPDVVHTMLTFGFNNGDHLALSVEPRRSVDQPSADALGSLFKQYQVIYILSDECDLLRLRTSFREGENLYVLPTTATRQDVREVFMMVIKKINALNAEPKFYNLFTHNCTTSLLPIINRALPEARWYDLRILLNANLGRVAYDRHWIRTGLSYTETFERAYANQYVDDRPECDGFSERIRPGLGQ